MKTYNTDGLHILKIEKGENVIASIVAFCAAANIENATFTGIGAVEWLSCGYYALDEKKYYFTEYNSLIEVASLTGNVMLKDGKPTAHAHGVFTNTKNEAFGGHIEEMRAGVVLEVVLTPLSSNIERTHDECIGLYLMSI